MNNDNEPKTIEADDLYHYTTQEGLLGILETNCLWATHYKFLNDYSELEKIKLELIKYISKFKKENVSYDTGSESFARGKDYICDTENIVNGWYEYLIKNSEFYITSFCGKHSIQNFSNDTSSNLEKFLSEKYINDNGLLSQWRAYGENGGYAIIFSRKKLQNRFVFKEKENTDKIFIKDVIYSNKGVKYFSKELPHLLCVADYEIDEGLYSMMLDELNPNADQELLTEIIVKRGGIGKERYDSFYDSLMRCIASYKDYGFHEEREVRLVVKLNKNSKKSRHFRVKDEEQIPYIKLFEFDKNLPIKKIIVGPHKDKEARDTWLKIKLDSMGRKNIDVTVSEIPFVDR